MTASSPVFALAAAMIRFEAVTDLSGFAETFSAGGGVKMRCGSGGSANGVLDLMPGAAIGFRMRASAGASSGCCIRLGWFVGVAGEDVAGGESGLGFSTGWPLLLVAGLAGRKAGRASSPALAPDEFAVGLIVGSTTFPAVARLLPVVVAPHSSTCPSAKSTLP